ncbi:MAG TPA: hypothetical protein PLJ21_08265 [Pseudobdellovibrionaceae bacterium]|nr:hypothetical protein [Pseudobdellovibrionaceae bacterium]
MNKEKKSIHSSYKTTLFFTFFLITMLCLLVLVFFTSYSIKEENQKAKIVAIDEHTSKFLNIKETSSRMLEFKENCIDDLSEKVNTQYLIQLSLFDEKGDLVCSIYKEKKLWKEFSPKNTKISLTEENLNILSSRGSTEELQVIQPGNVSLIFTKKIMNEKDKVFFLEKTIHLSEEINPERFTLLMKESGELYGSTHADFNLYTAEQLKRLFILNEHQDSTLQIRDLTYFFKTKKITWDRENLILVVGVNKDLSRGQEERILRRLFYVLLGMGLIVFIFSRFFSSRLVEPLRLINHFLSELLTKEEMTYLSIDSYHEFQTIANKLNEYNHSAFEQKKDLKKRILDLENTKKNLNRIQEDFISLSPLITAGEKSYIILNDLIESQKIDPLRFQNALDQSKELLHIHDSEKLEVDVIKIFEFELADLALKGRFNFVTEREYGIVPHFYCNPVEFRMALRKLLASAIEMMNINYPFKISSLKKNNSNAQLEIEFVSKANMQKYVCPDFSKALFLRNKISLNIIEPNIENQSQVKVSLWMN